MPLLVHPWCRKLKENKEALAQEAATKKVHDACCIKMVNTATHGMVRHGQHALMTKYPRVTHGAQKVLSGRINVAVRCVAVFLD